MFTTRFCTFIILAIGASVEAVPAPMKRDTATPALAARAPQFSVNIPNNVPVSGTFPNGITITPQTPSGSIVTGNNNSTLFGQFGFKRDDGVEARQFNFTLPNQLPAQGTLPFGLTVTQGAQNSTVGLPSGFPFKRDGDLDARQFNFTLPNQLPVEGTLPFGLTVTQGAQNSTVGLPSGFPFKRGLEARQFNFTLPNQLPVAGALPFGLTVTQGTQNSTVGLPSGFPFKRSDSAAPRALAARDGDANYDYNQPAYGCDNEDGFGLPGWDAEYEEHCMYLPHRDDDAAEEDGVGVDADSDIEVEAEAMVEASTQ
ncbi:unnamed protein product [Peniophora sp. CBMAI 1063]|nr:unnamed protein product [Peniophora sp. CBMAI 1063]